MSMYNMLHGVNPFSEVLMAMLGLQPSDCGRYRDCFLNNRGEKLRIVVYTRNGGGNREQYQPVIDKLAEHPCYLSDHDDVFDCTYASIFFGVPEEHKELADKIAGMGGVQDPKQMFDSVMNTLKNCDENDPDFVRIKTAFEPIIRQLKEAMEGGDSGMIVEV